MDKVILLEGEKVEATLSNGVTGVFDSRKPGWVIIELTDTEGLFFRYKSRGDIDRMNDLLTTYGVECKWGALV